MTICSLELTIARAELSQFQFSVMRVGLEGPRKKTIIMHIFPSLVHIRSAPWTRRLILSGSVWVNLESECISYLMSYSMLQVGNCLQFKIKLSKLNYSSYCLN